MRGHTTWLYCLDGPPRTRYKRGHVPADHPAAEQGRFGGALPRAGRERPPSRQGLRRGQGGAQLRPRRPARSRRLGAAGREHPADPGGGRRRSRRPCRLERGRDRDRGRLRARRRARGASPLGQARHRRGAVQARIAEKRLQAPHAAALLAMVAQRLDRPGSKLACHERWLDRVWLPEARELGLHQLYRAMDLLAEHGAAIEQAVFWRAVDLFKLDVDLVFYDATTAWFECDEEDLADHAWRGLTFEPLRRRGHSKEGRDNDPQVVALAVT